MIKKTVISVSCTLILFAVLSMTHSTKIKSCQRGETRYSVADYSYELFMKKKYQELFNSLLGEPVYKCFCKTTIDGLPELGEKRKKDAKRSFQIEPIFIDIESNDGIYSSRFQNTIPGAKQPHYLCGFRHRIFLLSKNTYYPLSSDSISNVNLIKTNLKESFTSEQIDRIIDWGVGNDVYCNEYSFDWPVIIKRDSTILWDINKEINNNGENFK